MLRSLREDVLPRFDPLDGEAHSDIPSDRRGRGLPDTRELPLFPPADRRRSERRTERLDLRDLVGEWAKRWHLTDEWCVRAARLQLRLWADPQLAAWLHEGEGSTDSWSPFRLWQTHRDIAEDGFTWAMPGERGPVLHHLGSVRRSRGRATSSRFPPASPGHSTAKP